MRAPEDPPGLVIHRAKLPMSRPLESLHVHPDAEGAVATDPERSGWRHLSFRAFGLDDGQVATLDHPGQEAAVVTISGGGVEIGRASCRERVSTIV